MLLTGSTGGGKSSVAANKLHMLCLRYPNATGLILRKTRESLKNSSVLMFDRGVVHGDRRVRHNQSAHRFEYQNGSIIAYGGMKDDEQRQAIRSIGQDGRVDFVWLEEATAFEADDFNELLARMRGKAAPFTQIMLSCNPDAPEHWINQRLIIGKEAAVYYSKAEDNPTNPDSYIHSLDLITGVLGERLRGGQWRRAAGAVFETYEDTEKGNVIDAIAEYLPGGGEVFWTIDDGYAGEHDKHRPGMFTSASHPRAILFAQLRGDGRMCIFNESVKILTLSDAHLRDALSMPYTLNELDVVAGPNAVPPSVSGIDVVYAFRESPAVHSALPNLYEAPAWVRVGHDAAEIRGRLNAAGIYSRGSVAPVEESIKVMRDWVSPDANGWRRMILHSRCRFFRSEMLSYRRDPDTGKPVKADDHTVDAARILTWEFRSQQ